MSHDLLIQGGTVFDGSGRDPILADVAITGGRIVEVGRVTGRASAVIDADGAWVTPGFIDLHTHYDGQATWDPELRPSSAHGVTTAVMGSCGVGFAPVRPGDQARLIELMEGVEDIPGTALHEGMRWGWESFPEYMDALDRLPRTMDLMAQVPHDVLRAYVMGERGAVGEDSTEADVAAMAARVREALEAGAVGFSTGRSDNHRTARGDYTPASEASARELQGIARAFHGLSHGVMQAVSDFDMNRSVLRFDPEFDLLEGMARASVGPDGRGRPLSISLMQRDMAPEQVGKILARTEAAVARGLDLRVQVAPRPIGVLLGLEASFHPFMGFPSYKAMHGLPLSERVARMRRPEVRAAMLAEQSEPVAGDGSPIPKMADDFLRALPLLSMRIFRLGAGVPCYEPDPDSALGPQAMRQGRDVREVLYEALLEDEGRALLYFPLFNFTEGNLETVRRMLTHPLALPGLSDGGAHVGTICDASFPTFLLSWWGRDRPQGRLPLPWLVAMMTRRVADFLGLSDRGSVAPGMRADLNVIDPGRLELLSPRIQADLPAGGRRLVQEAEGYVATLVAGQVVGLFGKPTGQRPGRLLRMGAAGPWYGSAGGRLSAG